VTKQQYFNGFIALLLATAVILAAGIGLRDPWPADEPRFALIARDMVESGQWLFPHVAGVLYPDKPPLFFWLVAAFYELTGSIRVAILLPGVLSGLLILALVVDLGRRLWGRETGLSCGIVLLAMVQFPLQMKSGQIDATLAAMTTAGLYGFARHLLLGPDWRWYAAAGFFSGLGVITKGVGFLPFLVLVPFVVAQRHNWTLPAHAAVRDARWLLAPVAFPLAIALWFVPMLAASTLSGDPGLADYRDDILFHQTVTRYVDAWHHSKPFWYLWANAVPWLWLPATLLLPWLVPAWRGNLRDKCAPVLLLGGWVLLVLLFFSLSSGKRSVYILPALPAVALLVGLHARQLFAKPAVCGVLAAFTLLLPSLLIGLGMYALMNPHDLAGWITDGFVVARVALAVTATGIVMLAAGLVAVTTRRPVGMAAAVAAFWLGYGLLVAPAIDPVRSGSGLIERVAGQVPQDAALGFVAWPEQFMLQWRGEAVHFGFRRNPQDEIRDAAAWVQAAPDRRLLIPERLLEPCFGTDRVAAVGLAHRRHWVLADGGAVRDGCLDGADSSPVVVHYSSGGRDYPTLQTVAKKPDHYE